LKVPAIKPHIPKQPMKTVSDIPARDNTNPTVIPMLAPTPAPPTYADMRIIYTDNTFLNDRKNNLASQNPTITRDINTLMHIISSFDKIRLLLFTDKISII